MLNKHLRIFGVALILASESMLVVGANRAPEALAQSYKPLSEHSHILLAESASGDYVLQDVDGTVACRDATSEESEMLRARDHIALHVISPPRTSGIEPADAGLKIVLRATQQLENFPQARNAFLRAAQTWENVIQTPITVVIDVDYGPLRFGQPYSDSNILGSTLSQQIGSGNVYPEVRRRLVSQSSRQQETELDNALPTAIVQTDIGNSSAIFAPSALFRALGIISPVADPSGEMASLGRPPSIGFNSAFGFDFDPADGIEADKTDFDAVAVHELGHALGFSSNVGALESNPSATLTLSLLDLFRVRPGGTLANFPSAQRVLSSGGGPVLFSGQSELALSTGRPNGSGGDGRQASHWKDDDLLGRHLGIMDPTIGRGLRFTITDNDLLAFDLFGYQVRRPSGGDTVALTSGVSQRGSISAPPAGGALVSGTQYTIQVPSGASELKIGLTGNQDADLYVRFNQRVAPGSTGQPQADHISDSPTGTESITISPSGSPSLKVGTYYVAVANFGPGTTSFDLVATVTGRPSGNSAPSITSLNADLDGDQLLLTGTVFDPDGDVTQAQSELFNSAGEKVGQTDPFPVSFGNLTTINFTVKIDNLNAIPAARLTSLIFLDRRGNRSNAMTADFGKSDPGGPTLANVSYNGSKMTIKGSSLGGQLQIEINGEVVVAGFSSAGNKVKLKGTPSSLNLLAGPNRVRVINGTLRSNLFVLRL